MNTMLNDAFSVARHGSFAAFALALSLSGPVRAGDDSDSRFQLRSATFKNHTTLPISTIHTIANASGVNLCSLDGSVGGNLSPELSWTNAPPETRTFAVIAFDTTASFTHWGIYNIAGSATGLPAGAGVPGSAYGTQVLNDFFDPNYDGPCPPTNVPPNLHHYVFTVYALSSELDLGATVNFPAYGETLLRSLLEASMRGELLGSASITGFYSTTPATQGAPGR